MVRASIGILGGITMLFVGWIALNEAADNSYDAAVTNGTNSSEMAWNLGQTMFEGVGVGLSEAVVWFGVAAFILISAGFLVSVAGGGGR